MADITGRYELHRDTGSVGMQIIQVDPSGKIIEGYIGQTPVHGQYGPGETISFNDARQPGDTLFVSFYKGGILLDGAVVSAMAGTYQEQEILIEPVREATGQAQPGNAAAGALTTVRPPVVVSTVTEQGAWYAIRLDGPLV